MRFCFPETAGRGVRVSDMSCALGRTSRDATVLTTFLCPEAAGELTRIPASPGRSGRADRSTRANDLRHALAEHSLSIFEGTQDS